MLTINLRPLGRLLLAFAAIFDLTSCTSGSSPGAVLTVLTPWTDTRESAAFQKVIDAFERENPGITVTVAPTRALNRVLQSDVQKGDPPDLAVLANPGALSSYARAGDLVPLDKLQDKSLDGRLIARLKADYGSQWYSLLEAGTADPYAIVIKANIKSLIWYDPRRLGGRAPADWSQLLALDAGIARTGATAWCLAVADPPTSGWPGTDWIEDILLHQSGAAAYTEWADGKLAWTSPQVVSAWQTWGQIVAAAGQIHGAALTALLTSYSTGDYPLFTSPPGCYLSHGALVTIDPSMRPQPVVGTDYDFFPFPSLGATSQETYEVSGDLMGMFRDSPQAEKLITFLASADAQRIWPGQQPDVAFSPDRQVARLDSAIYAKDRVAHSIDQLLTSSSATLCFDASDLMPDLMASAFYRAVLEYLQDPTRLTTILGRLDTVRAGAYPKGSPTFACGTGS
jgi:alpha-glucoside transport system substrate-binding protein